MKLVKLGIAAYIVLALFGKVKEFNGDLECNCNDHCWCKRSTLSLFRWVFPLGHSLP